MWIKTTAPLPGEGLVNTDKVLCIGMAKERGFPLMVKCWTTNRDDRIGCVLAIGNKDYCQHCFDKIKLGLTLRDSIVELESEEEWRNG